MKSFEGTIEGQLRRTLGIGFVGAGFINSFHVRGWTRVRDADIKAVCDVKKERAEALASLCRDLNVGNPTVYTDVSEIVNDPEVEALWLGVPNFAKLDVLKTVVEEVTQGKANLIGMCSEKPLARNVAEAEEMMKLVKKTGMLHGYLENQAFAPSLLKGKEIIWSHAAQRYGRPYLARAAEEHAGPHEPWFWQGRSSGGGVLLDMMCHSYEAGRVLLTAPREKKDALKPKSISAETAFLKWTAAEYVEKLKLRTNGVVDYSKAPCEDFARGNLTFETSDGRVAVVEATTSWSFVGAGLRLTFELLGPEYSLQINSLQPESYVFFSRDVKHAAGEELLEKQSADQGLMPVIADESYTYGYQNEDSHMVQSFLKRVLPAENWADGLLMVKLCMASYMAAESGRKLEFPPEGLETFIPASARG
jgi:predicted dehydrogenase